MSDLKKFFSDLTTQKDNATHDVGRTFIVVVLVLTPIVTFWGIGLETYHCLVMPDHQFDLQSFCQALGTFWMGLGGFLMSSSYSLKLKQSTETINAPGMQSTTLKTESTVVTPAPQTGE